MKLVADLTLFLAVLALIAIAALSGVWMKKPEKKEKVEDGVDVIVVAPHSTEPPAAAPSLIPEPKLYPL